MSEVQYPDNVAAGGRITGTTAALQAGARGITGAVRNSAGVYTVSLAEQLDQIEYVAVASLLGATGGAITCTPQATDGTIVVRTFSVSGGSGSSPEVSGNIDGLTVPGTPTFTGTGVTAISSGGAGTGIYHLTLAQAIILGAGAGGEGIVLCTIQGDAMPPTAADASIVRYVPVDQTHLDLKCQSNTLTDKDAKLSLAIWRFSPAPSAGGLAAADLDFALTLFRLNVANGG